MSVVQDGDILFEQECFGFSQGRGQQGKSKLEIESCSPLSGKRLDYLSVIDPIKDERGHREQGGILLDLDGWKKLHQWISARIEEG